MGKFFAIKMKLYIDALTLVDNNLIDNFSDIYYLKKDKLIKLDRMAEVSVNNLLNSINKSKYTSLSRFIHSLGIRNVGYNASKILESFFNGDIHALMSTTKEDLISINEIGPTMATSITDFFNNSNNCDKINRCLNAGVTFSIIKSFIESSISDKIFVFTGGLKEFSRNDAKLLIESYGAKLSNTISSKTDYLITGTNPGSKLKKAQKLNITILNEISFKELLDSM